MSQDILQEGHYVFRPLRTTEGNNQNRVVVHAAFHSTQPNAYQSEIVTVSNSSS